MFKKINTQILGAILLLGIVALYGCSGSGESSAAKQTVDAVAAKATNESVEATRAMVETGNLDKNRGNDLSVIPGVNEILIVDSNMYAATSNGLMVYNFRDQSRGYIGGGQKFNALAFHEGNLYIGGDHLYMIKDNVLEPVEMEYEATITALLSDSHRLLIGTESGLQALGQADEECLLDDVSVACLQLAGNSLWVGTNGQGLYRWDGDLFVKRYLIRDTSIFDYVYDLDFSHNQLFVGASTGFFVFDGGRWEQWTAEMGLPSNKINSIDASDWMVYIGTDKGAVSYFNKNLFPVKKFETMPTNIIQLMGNKIIAVDDNGGIFLKRGLAVKTLIEPIKKEETEVFTQADGDI